MLPLVLLPHALWHASGLLPWALLTLVAPHPCPASEGVARCVVRTHGPPPQSDHQGGCRRRSPQHHAPLFLERRSLPIPLLSGRHSPPGSAQIPTRSGPGPGVPAGAALAPGGQQDARPSGAGRPGRPAQHKGLGCLHEGSEQRLSVGWET